MRIAEFWKDSQLRAEQKEKEAAAATIANKMQNWLARAKAALVIQKSMRERIQSHMVGDDNFQRRNDAALLIQRIFMPDRRSRPNTPALMGSPMHTHVEVEEDDDDDDDNEEEE